MKKIRQKEKQKSINTQLKTRVDRKRPMSDCLAATRHLE